LAAEESEIKVTIKFFTTLREIVGKREEQLSLPTQATLKDAIAELSRRYGARFTDYALEKGEIKPPLQILINGRNMGLLQRMETMLKEGDTVAILPPTGGG
jgi:molybdopterin synthase sulfur carrier subunit